MADKLETDRAPASSAQNDPILLRCPSKYKTSENALVPELEWVLRTWHVTHSTLSMWRDARNVRITYSAMPAAPDGRLRLDDLVEYESNKVAAEKSKVKSISGVDTQSTKGDLSSWVWKGNGMLFFVQSRWEFLGWGERKRPDGSTERWAVTWFGKTLFSKEGIDIYSDVREGLSEDTANMIIAGLKQLDPHVAEMINADMQPVKIALYRE
jgi:hypothetical protein